MKMLRLVPVLLLAACATQAGPQPSIVSEFEGRDEIAIAWPEGVTVSRVNQLARTVCSPEDRRAIGLRTETRAGERVRVYRCEERLFEFP